MKYLSQKNNESYENSIKKHNDKTTQVGKSSDGKTTTYVFTKDNTPVAYIIDRGNVGVWKHSIEIKEYRKSKDEYPIYFRYWTDIESTREQAIKKAVDIAQEIYQFLQDSKVNQLSKHEK